ncbi:MAG: hypothetical protein RML38_09695 [Bacteroidia bacterium]|nr:hypothetical protein [Bacteroidia bacterium]
MQRLSLIFWAFGCGRSAHNRTPNTPLHRANTYLYTLTQLNYKKPFYFTLCKVLACKYLYFKLKQGKDMMAQVICVRGMEHAVRQCVALAKHRSEAQCGMPRPLRQQGTRPKENYLSDI